jgi:hypothetical protein
VVMFMLVEAAERIALPSYARGGTGGATQSM